ncbi:MAG TPA: 30S ribosomal protein S12 methylthiotransferase RimO, partial [Aquifex aeolicus]|nr:30S ribosomal protein S12 methylthiotransferase RimO [Aquifex aeolicus]
MGKSKVFLVSLGCAKNTVDSERVLGLLKERCSLTSDPSEAELILVNTCGFITPAKEESIETILELSEYKKKGAKLVVFGCLAKRYEKELKE